MEVKNICLEDILEYSEKLDFQILEKYSEWCEDVKFEIIFNKIISQNGTFQSIFFNLIEYFKKYLKTSDSKILFYLKQKFDNTNYNIDKNYLKFIIYEKTFLLNTFTNTFDDNCNPIDSIIGKPILNSCVSEFYNGSFNKSIYMLSDNVKTINSKLYYSDTFVGSFTYNANIQYNDTKLFLNILEIINYFGYIFEKELQNNDSFYLQFNTPEVNNNCILFILNICNYYYSKLDFASKSILDNDMFINCLSNSSQDYFYLLIVEYYNKLNICPLNIITDNIIILDQFTKEPLNKKYFKLNNFCFNQNDNLIIDVNIESQKVLRQLLYENLTTFFVNLDEKQTKKIKELFEFLNTKYLFKELIDFIDVRILKNDKIPNGKIENIYKIFKDSNSIYDKILQLFM